MSRGCSGLARWRRSASALDEEHNLLILVRSRIAEISFIRQAIAEFNEYG